MDVHRGIAVVLMILWHTVDSWLVADQRQGALWATFRFLGGMAAPSFVFLGGAGVGLKLTLDERAGKDRRRAAVGLCLRGAEIVVLGYLLRMQFWAIDSSGVIQRGAWRVVVPMAAGYWALLTALQTGQAKPQRALRLAAISVPLLLLGYSQINFVTPDRLLRVLRVDVLQAIGTSIIIATLTTYGIRGVARGWASLGLSAVVAFATPLMMAWVPGPLPAPIAGYIAAWPVPSGEPSPTLFPLFPWLAYVYFGAAVAMLWLSSRTSTARTVVIMGAAGLLIAVPLSESWPHTQRWLGELPWLTQPFRVAFRFAVALVITWVAYGIERYAAWLITIGRESLLIYWVHLEFAFGLIAQPFKKTLGLYEWCIGFVILTIAMVLVAHIRTRWKLQRFKRGP